MDLHQLLIDSAKREGFPLAGSVDIELALENFQSHVRSYDEWIGAGYAASMEYLIRGRDRRADPRLLFPSAQSVFCVALPYPRKPAGAPDQSLGPRYARYLQGPDYHYDISERLERVMKSVQSQWNSSQPLEWKVCVDTSAVLERAWASLAGLGWIGKNTLLIHPKLGSYLFLAEVLINQKTGRPPQPLPSYCGNCTKCLTSCPTNALPAPYQLNSNRCVSYLTLEKRGALTEIPENEHPKINTWVAGCDICQEVCPFNYKPSKLEEAISTEYNSTTLNSWEALLNENEISYKERVRKSAMKRIKPSQFRRNIAIALNNFLSQQDEALLTQLRQNLGSQISTRATEESDPVTKKFWEKCLNTLNRH